MKDGLSLGDGLGPSSMLSLATAQRKRPVTSREEDQGQSRVATTAPALRRISVTILWPS
jgi:hypothetical protein